MGKKNVYENAEDISTVYQKTEKNVCETCGLNSFCWLNLYNDTTDIMNGLCSTLRGTGKLHIEDVPTYFVSRCCKLSEVLADLQNNFELFSRNIAARSKIEENRKLLATQYSNMASILNDLSGIVDEYDELKSKPRRFAYEIRCSSAYSNKYGEVVCGDKSVSFLTENGRFVMALSDGMGSGKPAALDSTLAVTLLEKLIQSGLSRDSTIKLINSALVLKSSGESFATLDIAVIDLFTGVAEFLKVGAAPTFICRRRRIYRLNLKTLPAGILTDVASEKAMCNLCDGDIIVMVTDGMLAAGASWLEQQINEFRGNSPEQLSEALLRQAENISKDDDKSVMVGLVREIV